MIRSLPPIATYVDEICIVDTPLVPARLFTVLYEIVAIVICEDRLLIIELFFNETLKFLPSISIELEVRKY